MLAGLIIVVMYKSLIRDGLMDRTLMMFRGVFAGIYKSLIVLKLCESTYGSRVHIICVLNKGDFFAT